MPVKWTRGFAFLSFQGSYVWFWSTRNCRNECSDRNRLDLLCVMPKNIYIFYSYYHGRQTAEPFLLFSFPLGTFQAMFRRRERRNGIPFPVPTSTGYTFPCRPLLRFECGVDFASLMFNGCETHGGIWKQCSSGYERELRKISLASR